MDDKKKDFLLEELLKKHKFEYVSELGKGGFG